jgi:predicted transcriptional regulator
LYKKDADLIKEDLKGILGLKVEDVVGRNFFAVEENDSIFKVTDIFMQSMGLDPIPVIDQSKMLIGIICKEDLLKVLGDREKDVRLIDDISQKEKNVSLFLDKFSRQFMLVSKRRTRLWIVASILFVVVGFIIAFALILRINR